MVVPGRTSAQADVTAVTAARARLVDGMAAAVVERGYSATTIADVARHARVSKRTFYQHFADKQECFLAVYATAADALLALIAEAAARDLPWQQRVRGAVGAYLAGLQAQPELTRALFLEVASAGPAAVRTRRRVLLRYAELFRSLVEEGRAQHPELRALTPELAMAIVGGINELVLHRLEDGRGGQLDELADTAAGLVHAVLTANPW